MSFFLKNLDLKVFFFSIPKVYLPKFFLLLKISFNFSTHYRPLKNSFLPLKILNSLRFVPFLSCMSASFSFFLPSFIFSSHSLLSFPLSIAYVPFVLQIYNRRTTGRRSYNDGCVDRQTTGFHS